MTDHIKMLLCFMAILALLLMTGCSDGPEAVEQPKPLTKQDVKEAIEEATRPEQVTTMSEADRQRIADQTRGYTHEDMERKKMEAQKKYDDLQREKAEKEAQKNQAGKP